MFGWFRQIKQWRRDSNTLFWYRVRIAEYDRWLAEFPEICRVLENLKGQSEWEGRPGTVDISVLRDQIRNGSFPCSK